MKYFSVKLGVFGGVQLYTEPFLLGRERRLAEDTTGLISPLSNGLQEKQKRERERERERECGREGGRAESCYCLSTTLEN